MKDSKIEKSEKIKTEDKSEKINSTIDYLFENQDFDEEKISKFSSQLDKLNKGEFSIFLNKFRGAGKKRHGLPEEIFSSVLESSFKKAKEIDEKVEITDGGPWYEDAEDAWPFLCEVERAIQLYGDFERKSEGDLSSVDKSFLAFQKIYHKYPDQADAFWEVLSQDGQTINPEIFLEGIAKMYSRPEFSRYSRENAIHSLNYLGSFHDIYKKAIEKNLDFDNYDNFNKTGRFLEFLRKLHYISQTSDFSEELSFKTVFPVLEKVIEKDKGSYLLNQRARQVLNELEEDVRKRDEGEHIQGLIKMDKKEFNFSRLAHSLPIFFKISSDRFAIRDDQRIFIAPPGKVNFKDEFGKDDDLNLIRSKLFKNKEEAFFDHSKIIFLEDRNNFKELSIDDLFMERRDKTKEQREKNMQDIFDYEYLVSGFMREQVEKDFGIDLTELSMMEQNYFLQYIKKKNKVEIEPVTNLTKEFGLDGVRTFFSSEYGEEYGDRILKIGDKLEKEKAEEIFRLYSSIFSLSQEFSKSFSETMADKKNVQEFMSQLNDALLRRAKDVLNAVFIVLEKGQAKAEYHNRYSKKMLELTKVDEAIDSLKVLEESLQVFYDFYSNEEEEKKWGFDQLKEFNEVGQDPQTFHFKVTNKKDKNKNHHLMIQTRKQGVKFGEHNKEKEFDGEARINFVLATNPKNPENVSENINNDERKKAISFRLDREGIKRDKSGDIIESDPTIEQGNLSLDIGVVSPVSEKPKDDNELLGTVIAIGNAYSIKLNPSPEEREKFPEYYHSRDAFSEKFGKKEEFANLVEKLRTGIEKAYPKI